MAAIAQLGVLDPRESQVVLARVLEPREPLAVQVAAVRALAESESPEVAKILLSAAAGIRAVGPRWRDSNAAHAGGLDEGLARSRQPQ